MKNRLHHESGEQVEEPLHPIFRRIVVGQVWMELEWSS